MKQKLNEFGIEMGMATQGSTSAPSASITTGDYGTDQGDYVEVTDVPADPRRISVYAQSITPTSYSNDEQMATFDIVLTVGISEGQDGASKTYQVVKRIAIDKEKIADQVCASSPVSIVEAVEEKPAKAPQQSTAQIFRRLAGLG